MAARMHTAVTLHLKSYCCAWDAERNVVSPNHSNQEILNVNHWWLLWYVSLLRWWVEKELISWSHCSSYCRDLSLFRDFVAEYWWGGQSWPSLRQCGQRSGQKTFIPPRESLMQSLQQKTASPCCRTHDQQPVFLELPDAHKVSVALTSGQMITLHFLLCKRSFKYVGLSGFWARVPYLLLPRVSLVSGSLCALNYFRSGLSALLVHTHTALQAGAGNVHEVMWPWLRCDFQIQLNHFHPSSTYSFVSQVSGCSSQLWVSILSDCIFSNANLW